MEDQQEYALQSLDTRSQDEKEIQRKFVEQLHQRNIEALRITLTKKQKVKYQPSPLLKMELGHAWYCYYTDNKIKSKKTILAMHGAPGNHIQYAGIETEMKGYCRWVNLVIPGMDGQDERRGDYNGSFSHFSQMVLKLLSKLQIPKVVLCCHSFSSTLSPFLIMTYPDVFEGYISVAGIKDIWSLGIMLSYQMVTVEQRLKPWEFEDSRVKMYQRYLEIYQQYTLSQVEIPKFKMSQFFAFFKLTNKQPQKMDEVFQLHKRLKLLRVVLDGSNDPYSDVEKIENSVSQKNSPYYQKLFGLAKQQIEERLFGQFGVVVEGDRIQEYLCFLFKDTGHAVHQRRPKECSHIIQIYLACLEQMDKIKPVMNTCL